MYIYIKLKWFKSEEGTLGCLFFISQYKNFKDMLLFKYKFPFVHWDSNTQPTTHCYGNSVGFSFVFTFVIISLKVFQCFCTYIIKRRDASTSLQVTATARWVVATKYYFLDLEDFPRLRGWRVVFFFLFLEVIFLTTKTTSSRTIVLITSNTIWRNRSIGYTSFPHQMRKGQS